MCPLTLASPSLAIAQPSPSSAPTSATKTLTIDDALKIGQSQNRDLAAARARLKGAHADVERAMAALLPTLNAQARLTVNEPEVSVPFDQRQQVFSSLLQGAAISDASVALAKSGMLQSGSLTNALKDYCNSATGANRQAVDGLCQQIINPAAQLGKTPPSVADIDSTLTSANPQIVIQPRL
ncbi:MAG TPA: TolC family protein, partial [Pseudomonadota bacterium]|nr:TolC family protein [Pseudomonadota bacterium]